jgi:hypothetical protein
MTDPSTAQPPRPKGPLVAIRSAFAGVTGAIRRVIGLIVSVLARDSLSSLRMETQRLGTSAVESSSYVGVELRAIDERLSKLEDELAAVRRLLEERQPVAGPSSD